MLIKKTLDWLKQLSDAQYLCCALSGLRFVNTVCEKYLCVFCYTYIFQIIKQVKEHDLCHTGIHTAHILCLLPLSHHFSCNITQGCNIQTQTSLTIMFLYTLLILCLWVHLAPCFYYYTTKRQWWTISEAKQILIWNLMIHLLLPHSQMKTFNGVFFLFRLIRLEMWEIIYLPSILYIIIYLPSIFFFDGSQTRLACYAR